MIGNGEKAYALLELPLICQGIYSEGLAAAAPSVILLDFEVAGGCKSIYFGIDSQGQDPLEHLSMQ